MKRIPAGELARIMDRALRRRGLSAEHAGWVVDGLLETSLRGIDTHGVRLFPTYLAELDGGRARARPAMTWHAAGRAVRVLDAGHALGLVAGRAACGEAVRLARENGVGAVAVRSSNHFGAASVYTLEMARQGTVGFAFTNSDALVAPFHGLRPFFGTNPISIAAHGEGEDLFCADFATSQVSYSRVKHHRDAGLPLQRGWAVTPDGEDAAMAEPAEIGALQPLGDGSGHKGHCLGMAVEILCALLTGMPLDHELSHLYAEPFDEPRQVGHMFLALDVAAFQEPAVFRAGLSRLTDLVRQQPALAGERVMVPGDPERDAVVERRTHGISLEAHEAAEFDRIDREAGVAETSTAH